MTRRGGGEPVEQVERRGWVGFVVTVISRRMRAATCFLMNVYLRFNQPLKFVVLRLQSERIEVFPPSLCAVGEVKTALGRSTSAHFVKGTSSEPGNYTEETAGRAKVDKWWETLQEPVAYRYKSVE